MGKIKTVYEECDILVVGGGMAGTGADGGAGARTRGAAGSGAAATPGGVAEAVGGGFREGVQARLGLGGHGWVERGGNECYAVNAGDITAISLDCQTGARLHGLTVHLHHTSTALAGVTTYVRSGQKEGFTDVLDEQGSRFDVVLVINAVDTHGNFHQFSPVWGK